MATNTTKLELLLKEIKDEYVLENFFRLKLYLDKLIDDGILGVPGNSIQNIIVGSGSTGTGEIKKTMGCAATVITGAWVYQSDAANNFAISAVDNNPPKPVLGIVTAKPTATTCDVLFLGVASIAVTRGALFLGPTGNSSTTAPTLGYVQRLGNSFGDGEILVNPDLTRVRRI